jgi:glycosyltransferase involved in cell wall biosynthesis
MRLSIIIAVLESYEVVRRQLLHFKRMGLAEDIEIIILDDGSTPPIMTEVFPMVARPAGMTNLIMIQTHDARPWSQPCARNLGAEFATGEYLLMTDIDHVLSSEAILLAALGGYDKMMFPRHWGVLTAEGEIDQSKQKLYDYGLQLPVEIMRERGLHGGHHSNTFSMRASIFDRLGGYDERYCGRYGGDDVDLSKRYSHLCRKLKEVKPHIEGPRIWVYPDARRDKKEVLHSIRRKLGHIDRVDPVCDDCKKMYRECLCYYPKEVKENGC